MKDGELGRMMLRRLALGLILLAATAPFDRALYLPLRTVLMWENDSYGEIRDGLMAAKFLGSGLGTALIALAIARLDRRGWRRAAVLVVVVVLAGATGSGLKMLFGRERPSHLDQKPGEERLAFHGPARGLTEAPFQSFPSGHTLTSFTTATCLAAYYPPARAVFYGIAAATGVNRVVKHQHFPTDVVAGALIGHLLGLWLMWRPRLLRLWRREGDVQADGAVRDGPGATESGVRVRVGGPPGGGADGSRGAGARARRRRRRRGGGGSSRRPVWDVGSRASN